MSTIAKNHSQFGKRQPVPAARKEKPRHPIEKLLGEFEKGRGQLVLIVEREAACRRTDTSELTYEEEHYLKTRCTLGLLSSVPLFNIGTAGVPTVSFVSFDDDNTKVEHRQYFFRRHTLEKLGNRVHVGTQSGRMLEIIVGDDEIFGFMPWGVAPSRFIDERDAAAHLLGKKTHADKLNELVGKTEKRKKSA